MRIPEDARLEVKFTTRVHQADRIRAWLKMHSADFYSPYPNRIINNVYFDTLDCFSYSENLAGSSSRSKLRYRWYGDNPLPTEGVLELKLKRNHFGWKKRFKVSDDPCGDGDRWSTFRSNLEKVLDLGWKLELRSRPIQTIMNRYVREYYVSRDDRIRFTIDTDLTIYDQRYSPFPNTSRKANIPQTVIIECKFDRQDRDLATEVIPTLPIRVARSSKYVLGVKSVQGF